MKRVDEQGINESCSIEDYVQLYTWKIFQAAGGGSTRSGWWPQPHLPTCRELQRSRCASSYSFHLVDESKHQTTPHFSLSDDVAINSESEYPLGETAPHTAWISSPHSNLMRNPSAGCAAKTTKTITADTETYIDFGEIESSFYGTVRMKKPMQDWSGFFSSD